MYLPALAPFLFLCYTWILSVLFVCSFFLHSLFIFHFTLADSRLALIDVEDLVCDNPQQLSTGFFQSVEVGFEDVGMVLKQKKKGAADRVILDGSIRGRARPGRMLAIMGPSGR